MGRPRSHATQRPKFNAVCLFAGGGGLSLGLEQAGFRTILANDVEPVAAHTFRLNRPDVPFLCQDVRRISRSELLDHLSGRDVHLLAGGPPCQGFSTIGDQLVADVRNTLLSAFARILDWLQPPCFVMENVNYLRSQYGGRYEREVLQAFTHLGYHVYVKTLNAAEFGVPQLRQRVFFFGTRLPKAFEWPTPTHADTPEDGLLPYASVGEAIMDLAEPLNGHAPPNHLALRHSDRVIRRYQLIPEGGRMPPPQELAPDIRRKNFGNTYKRLHRARPSLTLVPGNNAFPVHPTLDRSLTPREAARLQSFPDTYEFVGNRAQQCRLVGNAVPVKLAKAVGTAIATHLRTRRRAANVSERQTTLFAGPQASNSAAKLRAVSFFTGIGSLMLGFRMAGFDPIASYDRKSIVSKNMALNFPDVRHYHLDVGELSASTLHNHIGDDDIDVVFGGPPCQGFSIFGQRRFVNTRGYKAHDDPRNELLLKFIQLATSARPKAIVAENVKGLVSTRRGEKSYLEELEQRLADAGYQSEWRIVNAAHYGVPQLRERFLLVAWRKELEFRWPEKKYHEEPRSWQRPLVTVGDVISDLMDPATECAEFSHVPMRHKELLVERYKLIPEGGRLPEKDLPERLRKGYKSDNIKNYSHVYRRLAMDRPATTMVPGHNAFPVHPRLHRTLTVREAARIQTIPDHVRFTGTRQQQCMLAGNAVPTLLAATIAQSVAKSVLGRYSDPAYDKDVYELNAAHAQS